MVDKVVLLYNPVAGQGRFKYKLDTIIRCLQNYGLQLIPIRINNNEYIINQLSQLRPEEYHSLIAAGGDGTVNGVVTAMMRCGFNVPLCILPQGTSNDVANYLNLPGHVEQSCRIIAEGQSIPVDLGMVNNQEYFINVASAGFITETAHDVDYRLKNALGRLAYYLKAMEKLPKIKPLQLKLDVDGQKYEDEILLFLILNGGTAGGFQGLLPSGCMSDGMLDFMAIKPGLLPGLTRLLINYQRGGLLEDKNVLHRRGKVLSLSLEPQAMTDLDGEKGPPLPWMVQVCPGALNIKIM